MAADQTFENYRKPTRRDEFLKTMDDAIVPWAALCEVIAPKFPSLAVDAHPLVLSACCASMSSSTGSTWLTWPVRKRSTTVPACVALSVLTWDVSHVPDSTTVTKFRKLMNDNKLGEALFAQVGRELQAGGFKRNTGTIVDATIIGAPNPTKNADKARDPDRHQTRKGQQWYLGMKLHIGVDSQSGLGHSAVVTAANVHDKHPLPNLLHGNERRVYGDSAYASQKALIASKAPKAKDFTNQRTRRAGEVDEVQRAKNRNKSRVRARVEHVFAVVKRLWGFTKVRYRGLQKNATRAFTALALANIYLCRGHLLGQVRP